MWVHLTCTLAAENGRPLLYASYLDMSEEVAARQDLALQKQAAEAAIEHADLFYWEYDMHAHVAHISARDAKAFGVSADLTNFPASLTDNPLVRLEDPQIAIDAFARIDAGSPSESFELHALMLPPNRWVWVHCRCTVIHDDDGRPVTAICTAENIDARKEVENTFYTVMHQHGLHTWKYDIARHTVLRGTIQSPLAADLPNIPDSLIERGIVHPEDIALLRGIFRRLDEGENELQETLRLRLSPTASFVWTQVNYTVLQDIDGRRILALGSAVDVSKQMEERHRYEAILRLHRDNSDPSIIFSGYYSVTANRQITVSDHTGTHLAERFPDDQSGMTEAIIQMFPNEEERKAARTFFSPTELTEAFERGHTSRTMPFYFRPEGMPGRYITATIQLLKNQDSDELVAFSTLTDITHQRLIEKQIARTVEVNYDFLVLLDTDTRRFSLLTNAASDTFPLVEGQEYEVVAANLAERYAVGPDRQRFLEQTSLPVVLAQLEHQEVYSILFTITGSDGRYHNKEFQYYYIDPQLGQLGIACMDVTETVREQQSLLHLLANSVERAGWADIQTNAFVLHTIDTVKNNLPPISGPSFDAYAFATLAGGEPHQLARTTAEQISLPAMVHRLAESPQGYDITYPLLENGQQRLKIIKIFWADDPHTLVGILRMDITEAEAEQQTQKAALAKALDAANEANRAKSAFLSRISHDMRTPLNGILGLAGLMRDKADPDDIRQDLDQLEISGRYLLNLINDTLDVSKIESGKMELHPTVCDGKTVLHNALILLRPNVQEKQIHFLVHTEGVSYGLYYIDAGRFEQLIMNIVSNAVKFTPAGGTVEFTIETIAEHDGIGRDRIIVRDTGIGMSPEFLPRLFTPFAQEDGSITNNTRGSGLGMAISKAIVELMNGTIQVESEKGSGTTFTIELSMPRATTQQLRRMGDSTAGTGDLSGLAGRHVLLCEDHPLNAQIARRLLEKVGIVVDHAENGQIGFEKFSTAAPGSYDAILMDIRMPVMDGLTATRAIRACAHPDAMRIPIIAMTANAFDEDVNQCLNAGMNAHLGKPVDPQKLYATLIRHLPPKA